MARKDPRRGLLLWFGLWYNNREQQLSKMEERKRNQ